MAKDVSNNPKNATALVTVNIVRNQYAPVFEQQVYNNASARDLDRYGISIQNVSAVDDDRNVKESANVSILKCFPYYVYWDNTTAPIALWAK